MQSDRCVSFYLDKASIKGHFCRLSTSVTEALQEHNYPPEINTLLAEMAAISQCFTMDIKSNSHATMQITGTSPVKLALVNSTNCESFRCCATLDKNIKSIANSTSLPLLFGQNGKLVFTIDFENQYYQTIVELAAPSLQECFQHYFIQSQQIPTIVLLCSKSNNNLTESAALVLQKVASSSSSNQEREQEIWHEASCFAATLKPEELISNDISIEKLLELTFGSLDLDVSRETSLFFRCTCSKEKIISIIKNFDASQENNEESVEVTCDYCNKFYSIDKTEIDS